MYTQEQKHLLLSYFCCCCLGQSRFQHSSISHDRLEGGSIGQGLIFFASWGGLSPSTMQLVAPTANTSWCLFGKLRCIGNIPVKIGFNGEELALSWDKAFLKSFPRAPIKSQVMSTKHSKAKLTRQSWQERKNIALSLKEYDEVHPKGETLPDEQSTSYEDYVLLIDTMWKCLASVISKSP